MLRPEEILAVIEEVARTHLDYQGAIRPDQHLVEDLGLESIERLTLAVELENRFRVCLEPEDEAEIVTIADLARTLARKLAERE